MKVLHVLSNMDPGSGGPARAITGLALAQKSAGLDPQVFSTYPGDFDKSLVLQLKQKDISVKLVGPTTPPLQSHPELKDSLHKQIQKADIVHIHALWEEAQYQAARISHKLGKPYIFRPCGMLDPWSLEQGKWKKKAYLNFRLRKYLDNASALHFTTKEEKDLTAPLKLKGRKFVLPNGIDLSEFQDLPDPGFLSEKYPETQGKQKILFLSRVHYKKGLPLLIDAFSRIDHENFVLIIAGPDADNYRAELMPQIESRNISDKTIFTGMLGGIDRIKAMVDADLFILPSHQENFGISVVEAMASGKPVIVSEAVNLASFVREKSLGEVVSLNSDHLLKAMKKMLSDRLNLEETGRRARNIVMKKYDWNRITKRLAQVYERILSSD